jgi:hypothetical protein
VRLQIEHALSEEQNPAIALFTLPASQGGYLETVRDVVTTTVVNELAAGQQIGNAQTDLAAGNDALAAKQYANAYKQYAQAYSEATS